MLYCCSHSTSQEPSQLSTRCLHGQIDDNNWQKEKCHRECEKCTCSTHILRNNARCGKAKRAKGQPSPGSLLSQRLKAGEFAPATAKPCDSGPLSDWNAPIQGICTVCACLQQNRVTVTIFPTRMCQNPRNMLRPGGNRVTVATFQGQIYRNLGKTHVPK